MALPIATSPHPLSEDQRESCFTSFNVPSVRGTARVVRRRVLEFARHLPLSKGDLQSIEIAVGEATVNAVRHGSPLEGVDHLQVTCEYQNEILTIEISDQGNGFMPANVPCPVAEDLKSDGYGICLMNGLMDQVRFSFGPDGGTTVRMVKRVSPVPQN
ncbi:MAG: ATP-binding protein [Armatimonadetes bacterium]|nr:ATP-binding protein [Armatimonadota bacterium]